MSAGCDLDILGTFLAESALIDRKGNSEVCSDMLWLASFIAKGTWCDFTAGVIDDAFYADTWIHLNAFDCRPLLAPWLEARPWSLEEVNALKVSHALKPPAS